MTSLRLEHSDFRVPAVAERRRVGTVRHDELVADAVELVGRDTRTDRCADGVDRLRGDASGGPDPLDLLCGVGVTVAVLVGFGASDVLGPFDVLRTGRCGEIRPAVRCPCASRGMPTTLSGRAARACRAAVRGALPAGIEVSCPATSLVLCSTRLVAHHETHRSPRARRVRHGVRTPATHRAQRRRRDRLEARCRHGGPAPGLQLFLRARGAPRKRQIACWWRVRAGRATDVSSHRAENCRFRESDTPRPRRQRGHEGQPRAPRRTAARGVGTVAT